MKLYLYHKRTIMILIFKTIFHVFLTIELETLEGLYLKNIGKPRKLLG